ncbi:hypothetical protein GEMRC1_008976 [Eukaryota sp. GEM-RC1]
MSSDWITVSAPPRKPKSKPTATKVKSAEQTDAPKRRINTSQSSNVSHDDGKPITELHIPQSPVHTKKKSKSKSKPSSSSSPAICLRDLVPELNSSLLSSKLLELDEKFPGDSLEVLTNKGKLLLDIIIKFFSPAVITSSLPSVPSPSEFSHTFSLPSSDLPPSLLLPVLSAFNSLPLEAVSALLDLVYPTLLSFSTFSSIPIGLLLSTQCLLSRHTEAAASLITNHIHSSDASHFITQWLSTQILLLPPSVAVDCYVNVMIPFMLNDPSTPHLATIAKLGALVFALELEEHVVIPRTVFQMLSSVMYKESDDQIKSLVVDWYQQFELIALLSSLENATSNAPILLSLIIHPNEKGGSCCSK